MSLRDLERFEAKVKAAREAELETLKLRELRKQVKSVIPKNVLKAARAPGRRRGRSPEGGVSKKEVAAIRKRATAFLDGDAGLAALQLEVQQTAIVILLIDGVMGTEPWRASGQGGPHAGIIAASARVRYLDNAARLLDDLRRSRGQKEPKDRLLEGVIDAEVVK